MNRTLKFAMAAAIASMGIAGQAHALTQSTVSTSGSLFLYVFEDRVGNEPEANPLATNSAVFDLGLASAFNTGANNSWNFSNDSAWTSYISTIANTSSIHWGVYGTTVGNSAAGTTVLTTKSVDNAINGQNVSNFAGKANSLISVYGAACSSCGFSEITTGDAASASWDDNGGVSSLTSVLTTSLGQSMDFYKYVSTGTKAANMPTATAFAFGGDADYFTLSSTGALTYTVAAVPEAETYAMMLAGLGLVGFMVRRRKFV
ncbi:MAG: PEP-CTERM sorting domain-containing protein [Pseudomonadota bacterium]